jgi:hypothetical protein
MKKLLFILVLISFTAVMTSCSSYIGERTSKGCGVWYPKKFEKGPRWTRGRY